MASIEVKDITTNSFEVRAVNLSTSYFKYLHWFLNNIEQEPPTSVPLSESATEWREFTDLSSNTSYTLRIEIENLNEIKVDEIKAEIITEAEEEDPEWSVTKEELGKLSNDTEATYWIDSYRVLRLKISFENSGTATFSSKNAYGAYGFLSTSTSFDDKEGEPVSYSEWDYSSSGNFSFEGTVSSGTTYYLYVRHYDGDDSRNMTIKIIPPAGTSSNRPNKFKWKNGTEKKESGKPFDITAEEWGNLLDNINAVREYKEYSAISSTSNADAIAFFYYPSKGDNFLASMYNQCIYAFADMELLNYSSYRVLRGDPITADAINFLVETINSVE